MVLAIFRLASIGTSLGKTKMKFLRSVFAFILGACRFVGRAVGWFLSKLFGSVAWQSPPWLAWLGGKFKRATGYVGARPKQSAIAGTVSVALLAALAGGWWWWEQQPKPVESKYTVTAPERTA